ncbi:winged helix-turn-helix transcriptional regulator [Streptomyces bryophytorum]|uniref:ArsR/SmtB family transcription factor n=1 Tax=Actinacidiphila bryophytorum TaxID=1436133 RepID=UPI00195F8C6D|nr:helix-turn-helix domain-containing protein [Actinacidiphila bryophytorum]MBM9438830.1 winged helix-turn-helix transcriptional regulator [Actinacidiphila bryophytorum]
MHFTAEDLLRVRMADEPAPLMELGLALMTLKRRSDPVFGQWRHRAQRVLPPQARPVLDLLSTTGTGPLFLDPPTAGFAEGMDTVRSTPRASVRSELLRVRALERPRASWVRGLADDDRESWQLLERSMTAAYTSLLADAWPRVRAGFQAEVAWRARHLARHGLLATLTGLSSSARWNGMTLEYPPAYDREIRLTGQGVVLLPSLLWTAYPLLAPQPGGPALLIYPAVTPLPLQDAPATPDPLNALLGTTRAAMLRLLTTQHTTSGLARALDISPPAASMQARTLRDARLITTQREGKSVSHYCTALGLDMITASTPPLGDPSPAPYGTRPARSPA